MVSGSCHSDETRRKMRAAKLGRKGNPHRKGVPISKNATVTCGGCGTVIENTTANRRWCADCKKEIKVRQDVEYRKRHVEEEKERHRKFYQNVVVHDKDRLKRYGEASRQWYQSTREIRIEIAKLYRIQHPEYILKKREYEKEHPELKRVRENRRRARKRNAIGRHTAEEFFDLCESHKWKCSYCGQTITKRTASEDHKIPLSRGGGDSIDNIAPACRKCNSRKCMMTTDEFIRAKEAA